MTSHRQIKPINIYYGGTLNQHVPGHEAELLDAKLSETNKQIFELIVETGQVQKKKKVAQRTYPFI